MRKLIFYFRTYGIVFVLLVAAIFRLYRLDTIPPSLYWEEVAIGYDAYSIARTGKDHHGNVFPILAFPSFGDYKPSGYFYTVVPFVATMGLNAWAVRLPSALAGIGTVFILYLVGKELFDKRTGLLAAVLLAIQPWHIQFSRGGWEVNLATLLLVVGSWLLLKSRHSDRTIPMSAMFFGLSMYTYHAARLFAPLMFGVGTVWLLYVRREKKKKFKWSRRTMASILSSMLVFILFLLPFLVNLSNQSVSSRFTQTTIFFDIDPVLRSNQAKQEAGNTLLSRMVHHRYRYYAQIIGKQWLSHFSAAFLFLTGDGNYRHVVRTTGMLYGVEALFISMALFGLIVQKSAVLRSKVKMQSHFSTGVIFLLIWIGLAAAPAALVKPAPHTLRFLFAAPAFALLASSGFFFIFNNLKVGQKKIFLLIVVCVYVLFTARYVSTYLLVYPVIAAGDWQYGYKQLFAGIEKYKEEGEQVYITREQGRPAMYYLFYSQFDPRTLQEMESTLPKDQLELLRVEDYHFVDTLPTGPGLFATSEEKQDPNAEHIGYIRRPDWSIVWTVWRRK